MTGLGAPPRARRSDPITSHEAADSIDGHTDAISERIKSVLGAAYPEALAVEQIASRCEFDKYQVNKRMSELRDNGGIEETCEYHRNESGRRALKWRLLEDSGERGKTAKDSPAVRWRLRPADPQGRLI